MRPSPSSSCWYDPSRLACHAPVYPDLLLTHMMLCFAVLVVGHLAVDALNAFPRTRFRYRPRVQIYLLLFAAPPLVVLLLWTCGVVVVG